MNDITSIKLDKEIRKELAQLKLNFDLPTYQDVIKYLIKNQKQ